MKLHSLSIGVAVVESKEKPKITSSFTLEILQEQDLTITTNGNALLNDCM